MTEGSYQMFWASQSLESERMNKYRKDIKDLKQSFLDEGSMIDEDFETRKARNYICSFK